MTWMPGTTPGMTKKTMPDIKSLTAAELLRLYRKRELSPVEVTRDQLDRIEKFEPALNAFIIVDRDGALKAAKASEARWQQGRADRPRRRHRRNREGQCLAQGISLAPRVRSPRRTRPMKEDAPAVARLREAGAVILGKTTLPEFGWIGACHSPLTGITRNPWKLDRTPGGSSGGAACAALLNLGHLHIGTDGAGSIRIPAAFTGVFGIKPSFGRVRRLSGLAVQHPRAYRAADAQRRGRRADALGDRRAGRARHDGMEHAGARLSRRPRRWRARPAHRVEPAARLREEGPSRRSRPRPRRPRRRSPTSARSSRKPIRASPTLTR